MGGWELAESVSGHILILRVDCRLHNQPWEVSKLEPSHTLFPIAGKKFRQIPSCLCGVWLLGAKRIEEYDMTRNSESLSNSLIAINKVGY